MARISAPIKRRARRLRGIPTAAEQRLWACLRSRQLNGWHFRRQHPIPPYVVDFACLRARLVVEADGGQHAESADDRTRDLYLRQRGWQVLRFWNHDILSNPEGVVATIAAALPGPHPDPPPLQRGREGPPSAGGWGARMELPAPAEGPGGKPSQAGLSLPRGRGGGPGWGPGGPEEG
ncbi:MAG: endonuclease domain-containing protein [Geminicoccales bacterium]